MDAKELVLDSESDSAESVLDGLGGEVVSMGGKEIPVVL